jgi:hypothetical protein
LCKGVSLERKKEVEGKRPVKKCAPILENQCFINLEAGHKGLIVLK